MKMDMNSVDKEPYIDDRTLFLVYKLADSNVPVLDFLKFNSFPVAPFNLSQYTVALEWSGIYTDFNKISEDSFAVKIGKKAKARLMEKIEGYLKNFQEGNLSSKEMNILTFQKHKELIDSELKILHQKYGADFSIDSYDLVSQEKELLPLHYLLWLQMNKKIRTDSLNYSVKRFQHEDYDFLSHEDLIRITSKIGLSDEYIASFLYSEIDPNTESLATSRGVHFDEVESILYIRGKQVRISKKILTKPHILLSIISSNWDKKEWTMEDLSKLWTNKYDTANTYYKAARDVVGIVENTTSFEDFFITTKLKIKLNRKYLY